MEKFPVKISGIGIGIPETVVTNDDLAKFLDTSDEWITTRTGIKERRVVSGNQTAIDLGEIAAKEAIKNAKINVEDIDVIVCASSCPPNLYPSCGCEIQARIGAINAFAFDITAACTGLLYAMDIANSYINSGKYNNILIVATDTSSKFVDWSDRATCVLFGDAAGAMVLRRSEENESDIINITLKSNGNLGNYITLPFSGNNCPIVEKSDKKSPYIQMLGKDVYKFVVSTIPGFIVETIEKTGLNTCDIDYLIPHQANIRIIEAMQNRLGFCDEKVISNIQYYGNTSAASILIAMYEGIKNGNIKLPSKVILCAFGAGMTWGASIIKINDGVCL